MQKMYYRWATAGRGPNTSQARGHRLSTSPLPALTQTPRPARLNAELCCRDPARCGANSHGRGIDRQESGARDQTRPPLQQGRPEGGDGGLFRAGETRQALVLRLPRATAGADPSGIRVLLAGGVSPAFGFFPGAGLAHSVGNPQDSDRGPRPPALSPLGNRVSLSFRAAVSAPKELHFPQSTGPPP
jgi:hypothetical protein